MIDKIRRHFAEQKAAGHVARMFSGSMSQQQAQGIAEQRADSTEYRQNFLATVQVVAGLEELADDPDMLKLLESDSRDARRADTHQSPAEKNSLLPKVALAAMLLIAIVAGYQVLYQTPAEPSSDIQRYVTRIGEQKTVTLEDGSTISMNTASQLFVDINDSYRRITLDRGEAYFDVAKDSERPFTVDFGSRSVSVLGTEFNIRKNAEKITVAVLEGVIAMHRKDEPVLSSAPELTVAAGDEKRLKAPGQCLLKTGMVVEFDVEQQALLAFRDSNIQRRQEWRGGVIRFDNQPLHKVIQELNRYSVKKILIEDPELMEIRFFAAVKVDDLGGALRVLENTLPVKVVHRFDQISIVKK